MFHKFTFSLLAATVFCLGSGAAWANGGGGGDYPPEAGYSFLMGFNSQRACHLVQRRVLTRDGWRRLPVQACGQDGVLLR